ncbi:flagellar assembly factor FliW [Insulibacter thermoxylanivorax]|uniref:Flagellar assembly factor FliW n=1 Tax=Insulibacter thermoxylanivorax TaxID=2749268 RepID=A0A916VIC3_9BACL|nr:flagellar assembly protein FliW [Insulibacter thermoxylanivorax]GFR39155.1 flagellar assembly factor FliW [Insulibacter thermoxylanivorax]
MNQPTSVLRIESEYYGTFKVDESQIYHFPKGIIGFEEQHDYALIQVEDGPFYVLHAASGQLSFILLPGNYAAENYGFHINQSIISLLDIQNPEDVITFVIVNVIDDQLYVNLKAPLIFNRINRKGAQFIIDDASYPLRHPLVIKEGP